MATPETRLSDLNHDCLINILERLNLAELFSAAQADTRLNEAAGSVFSRKYSRNSIKISGTTIKTSRDITKDRQETDVIRITGPTDIAVFFRHFGPHITLLHLSVTSTKLEGSLHTYCRHSLVDLTLFYEKNFVLKNIRLPFVKLQKLSLINGILDENVSQLHLYFPQLQALNLCMVDFEHANCVKTTLPLLLSLGLEYNGLIDRMKSSIKPNLFELIRLNKQLRQLNTSFFYLYEAFDWEFYKGISDHLKQLEVLKIHDEAAIVGGALEFDTVETFQLKCNWAKPRPIFRFNKLKEFSFAKMPEVDGEFIDVLVRNRDLRKIELLISDEEFELSHDDLMKLASLPELEEFHLRMTIDSTSVGDIETFARECKPLQRLWLELEALDNMNLTEFLEELTKKLSTEWKDTTLGDVERSREVIFQRR